MASNIQKFSLTKYGILTPEKVRWIFPNNHHILDQIRSKSLRQFLAKSEELMLANHIHWEIKPMDLTQFKEWLNFYERKMKEQNFEILADENWFQRKMANQDIVNGYFFYQNQILVGTAIVLITEERTSLAYKASEKIDLSSRSNTNLGSLIEYIFLTEAVNT